MDVEQAQPVFERVGHGVGTTDHPQELRQPLHLREHEPLGLEPVPEDGHRDPSRPNPDCGRIPTKNGFPKTLPIRDDRAVPLE